MTTLPLRMRTPAGRLAVAATVVGSGAAFVDQSVVNVALPSIGRDLGGGFATAQWVVDGYLLTFGALVLVGGALGDLFGRRRVYEWGLVLFVVASVACGLAPTSTSLVLARTVQGVGAALLVPGSLALLSSSFAPEDRGRAIGSWSGLGTVFAAAGPFLGGLLVATGPHGWRWIFLVNVPVVAIALVLSRRGLPDVPGSRTQDSLRGQVDAAGAMLAVLGLGLLIAPLIEVSRLPLRAVVGLMAAGAATLVAFGLLERRRTVTGRPPAMLPVHLFAVRAFTVANVVTFAVYGALGAGSFLLTIALQVGLGYEPWAAGLATLPMTVIVAAFSPTVGSLVPRFGPRPFLALGPAVIATALIVLSRIAPGSQYVTGVLPGVLLFGAGLALVVAPVTTAAVAYVGQEHSGVASGVNNAVARIGTLVTVALIPVIGGLSRAGLDQSQALVDGYARAMASAAALTAAGAVAAWFGLPSGRPPEPAPDRPAS